TFVGRQWLRALLLAGWGVLIINPVDNLLVPMVVGKTLRLHTLLIFFAIVGGLAAFGASGVVLGLIVAVAVALFESKGETYPPRVNACVSYFTYKPSSFRSRSVL